jgi:hypothetical protein
MAAVLCLVFAALGASAQPMAQPPPSGLYERWSPTLLGPVVPLSSAPPALAEWLSVETRGSRARVVFEPARRVVWQAEWGPHGVTSKRTLVDGVEVSRSEFVYDAAGHLLEKRTTGALAHGTGVVFRTDARGRIVERRETVTRMNSAGTLAPIDLVTTFSYGARGVVQTVTVGGRATLRATLDASGAPLTVAFDTQRGTGRLVYSRDRTTGRLQGVERTRGRVRSAADASVRDRSVTSTDVMVAVRAELDRADALLYLGSPHTSSDQGRGADRRISDHFAEGCWLNETSSLEFDGTGAMIGGRTACICGFCVDAALAVDAEEIEAVDVHWTTGPWIRLDGAVDVTADHEVLTARGWVPAGELVAGEPMIDGEGRTRVLERVERLPVGPERLGRNVRTRSRTFRAGGFVFLSEEPTPCTPDASSSSP